MKQARISTIADSVGQHVQLSGWLYNKRSSKKLHFLQVRDGSGIIQAVVGIDDVGPELFDLAGTLTQESSVKVDGIVQKDPRSPIGYELHVKGLELVSRADNYPISKKE